MEGIISSLFQLILRVLSKLAPDAINKSLRVPKVLLEKDLEFRPCDCNGALVAALVLGLFEADDAVKESGGKWGTVYSYGA